MSETAARLLRLLSLLQTPHRDWTGAELAEHLDVTARTVRKDVGRLRGLGYPIDAKPGVAGGYRLGTGARLPPLLLDDEEAIAIAVGLRTAAGGSVAGIAESSMRALAKLEHLLPSRLRHRVNTLHNFTVPISGRGPTVDPSVLTTIAGACHNRQRLRFDYRNHQRAVSRRDVEPHRLVHDRGRWYLLAFDVAHHHWRTFRVDRIQLRTPATGPRFTPRDPPDSDVATYVARGVGAATWQYRARVLVHAPAPVMAARLPPAVTIEPVDEHTCIINTGADDPHTLTLYLGMLDTDFEIIEPPELVHHIATLANRYRRASTTGQTHAP